ncbi:DUF6982 domain-containing protein [Granulicella arctica]|uniref:Uncharacterized protein n=1 Tax=Granulicella arctica TaxID=940613 RepID=A0A7Y9PIS2_9BACT|nr:hypothetical protein [Granulicella arctica]NYF80662.1 hypothetical protein [Granulicella arctica]
MSSSQKKVIVRRFAGDVTPGYLPLNAFVRQDAATPRVDLLDLSGRVISLHLNDIKTISYVRDFNLNDTVNPERLARRTFLARPRTEGLWVRLTFRGGDLLEGLAPTDLSLLSNAIEDIGLHLTPPDIRSNTQRIFVPRSAITDLQLIAVITTPSRKKPLPTEEAPSLQDTLFETLPPNSRPN